MNEAQAVDASRWLGRVDNVGIAMSGLCAVHCALTPILALVMPLLGSHEAESSFRLVLASLGVLAVGIGIVLHRSVRAVPLLAVALALFVVMALVHFELVVEISLSILASAALIAAHRMNSLACKRRCEASHCGTDGAQCEG